MAEPMTNSNQQWRNGYTCAECGDGSKHHEAPAFHDGKELCADCYEEIEE